MLTPDLYSELPGPLEELAQDLEEYILRDVCRRLRLAGEMTGTAEIQMIALIEQGKSADEIQTALKRMLDLSGAEISEMFEIAARESLRFDAGVYKKLGREPTKLEDNDYLQATVRAQASATQAAFRNMAHSVGFAVHSNGRRMFLPAARALQYSLDKVQTQVLSGGVDYNTAIRNAVRELTASGLRTVEYASGRTDQLDVAIRRATVTGMSQLTGEIVKEQMRELDTDLVEVSAHGGARDTGSGFENHKQWQGKVYSMSGNSKKYPPLKAKTGYGNVAGLKGANCRHDFHPFIEGVSQRQWTDDELANIDPPPFTYEGKTYTKYEATQQQRRLETAMRKAKRECIAFDASGDEEAHTAAAVRLRRLQEYYKDFSKVAGLRKQPERAQVMGFGADSWMMARTGAEEYYSGWSKDIGLNNSVKNLAKYYDIKYNNPPEYELLKRYARGVEAGWISPNADFGNYKAQYSRIQTEFVGKTAISGTKIEGQSEHFMQRVLGTMVDPQKGAVRSGVTLEDIADALFNAQRIGQAVTRSDGRRSVKLYGARCVVSINPDTGELIQTNPRKER